MSEVYPSVMRAKFQVVHGPLSNISPLPTSPLTTYLGCSRGSAMANLMSWQVRQIATAGTLGYHRPQLRSMFCKDMCKTHLLACM